MDSMAYSSRSVGMHIIKEDIYNLCNEFFEGNLNLKAINNSFITLIPKCNNPILSITSGQFHSSTQF